MAYERYPRSTGPQGDYSSDGGYGRDRGGDRDRVFGPSRDYRATGQSDRDDRYGQRADGGQHDDQRSAFDRERDAGRGYGRPERSSSDWGHSDQGRSDQGRFDQGRSDGRRFQERGDDGYPRGGRDEYHGSYAADGRRFEDVGRHRQADDDDRRDDRGYGRRSQGQDHDDRGFFQRAGDEVRSWFGDDEAERRREADARYDGRDYRGGGQHDDHYGSWRSGQIAAFDRDYDEYRTENRSRFESEFARWRTNRQTQRDSLGKVTGHQEVVGSDGAHVGTVDKVRGDRILLTKNDPDAGGRHHSIPSAWLASVDDKVTLSKTADEAKAAWRDEERNQAMFGDGNDNRGNDRDNRGATTGSSASATSAASASTTDTTDADGRNPNRSFPGTY